ncbi:MAG: Thiamine biosynthesis lipoprotein ApbE precursor [Verrucomicrobiota bacterium]|jgi:thiamine biosynthesis lipoprotein ApbE/Na+-translocating ferredoxin:NAD+ oxidoreductase RnfG subunit
MGRLQAWAVRLWRLGALGVAVWLLQLTTPTPDSALAQLTVADAQAFFPEAVAIKPGPQATLVVRDQYQNKIGLLLTTQPEAEKVLGYQGPSNILVALDNHDRVVGTRILSSEDTPGHVDKLRDNPKFAKSLRDWRPTSEPAPKLEGYAGSTLTALSIVQSIQQRTAGTYASLRFPTPLSLDEVKQLGYPTAAGFERNVPRLGWNLVRDAQGKILGYAVRSSPSSDEINGYAGPSETLIAVDVDQLTIRKIVLRETYDTTQYVQRIYDDEEYLKSLTKWNTKEWPKIDFTSAQLEGVAGATLTSYAIAEGIKQRFADDAKGELAKRRGTWDIIQQAAGWCFLAGALLMTFTTLHGKPWVRTVWQLLLVAGLGLWLGQMISLSLFVGWARHGLPGGPTAGLVALGAIALLIPWSTRRQAYCHQICPHGAAQELLGRFPKLHLRLSAQTHRWLRVIPFVLLGGAFLAALLWPRWSLGQLEPFDAWLLSGVALSSAIIAVLGLIVAVFIPQGFCKYGCPTGALLNFTRTQTKHETWAKRDTFAALLLLVGVLLTLGRPRENLNLVTAQTEPSAPVTEMHGGGFGTTWTVKVRGPIADRTTLHKDIEAEINRVEFSLSHWRKGSQTSRFNELESTQAMAIDAELAAILTFTQKLWTASERNYDITVAPLSGLWGYGPAGSQLAVPTAEKLRETLTFVGSDKLALDAPNGSLRKSHPRVQVDLGSVLQGYAADRLAQVLRQAGQKEFLIEVGGELLAAGSWQVGIEDPFNPRVMIAKPVLKDMALSPSGLYRAKRQAEGKSIAHILSPKTGQPVEPTLELCCVYHASGLQADGWSTALMAAGWKDAQAIADREGLAVMLVGPKGEVWKSKALQALK